MLSQETPTIGTNGNGHKPFLKIVEKKSKRTAPPSEMPQPVSAVPLSNEIRTLLEAHQARLMKDSIESGSRLTTSYDNWFESNIERAKTDRERASKDRVIENPAEMVEFYEREVEAWRRARDLFFQLAHVTLQQNAAIVAEQIRREYDEIDHTLASDVSDYLEVTSTTEIAENYR